MATAALVMAPEAAVTLALPAATAVTRPLPLTVATLGLLLTQVSAVPVMALPLASLTAAVNCWVAPMARLAEAGLRTILATGPGVVLVLDLLPAPPQQARIRLVVKNRTQEIYARRGVMGVCSRNKMADAWYSLGSGRTAASDIK